VIKNNFIRYRHNARIAAYACYALSVIFIAVLFLYSAMTPLLIAGVIGLTFSLVGVFASHYFSFYYKVYGKAIDIFETEPVLGKWTFGKEDWIKYIKAEKSQRNRDYLKYLLMAPVLIAFIAFSLLGEVDDLSFDMTLAYWAIGAFVLTMVLLYINMKNTSLKAGAADTYTIVVKSNGVKINDVVHYWGKAVTEGHNSVGDFLMGAITVMSEAEREIRTIEHVNEGNLHYLRIEYKPDDKNITTLFIPLPESEVVNIDEFAAEILRSKQAVAATDSDTQRKKYNTVKIARWAVAIITVVSVLAGLYQFALPIYNASLADRKYSTATGMFERGSYDSAYQLYQEVVVAIPDYPEAWVNMGVILMSREQFDSAQFMFDQSLAFRQNYDLALYNKAYSYYVEEKYPEAIAAYQTYHQAGYGENNSYLALADAFMFTENADSALYYYTTAYDGGARSATLSYNRAILFEALNQDDLAISSYEESLQQDTTNSNVYFGLAALMEKRGQQQIAHELMQKGEQLTAQ
jgi:Flp pilus assembly protein TadD